MLASDEEIASRFEYVAYLVAAPPRLLLAQSSGTTEIHDLRSSIASFSLCHAYVLVKQVSSECVRDA
jgi:hypothetical protein